MSDLEMCGRYSQTAGLKTLRERFGFAAAEPDLGPRYNIAPSQEAPVIVEREGRRLELFRWGLIPSWAKDPAIGRKLINARAETIQEKPSFKKPFRRTRCLVAADGFYEWRQAAGAKKNIPLRIVLRSREPFAMAGLWDVWRDPAGDEIRTFAIITTRAAASLRAIHDRMPVILRPESEGRWLDPEAEPGGLAELLVPREDEVLESYEVPPVVNSPTHDNPDCVAEVRDLFQA